MGDDITIVVPEMPPEPDTEIFNQEEVGEELLRLIDTCLAEVRTCHDRIAACEQRIIELEGREYATLEHTHDGFAATGHSHDEYAPTGHQHESEIKKRKEPDRPPESSHWYFRKIGD